MSKLIKCGGCPYARYIDSISEWFCDEYNTFIGYNMYPYKIRECSRIGDLSDQIRRQLKWLWNAE